MDVLPVATEESNVMRHGPYAIVVAKGTDSVNFHHRSSHRSGSTGHLAVRQSLVPTSHHRKTVTDGQRLRNQSRIKSNRIRMLRMLPTAHLRGKRPNRTKIEHPSNHGLRNQTLVRAQPSIRTLRHLLMSGNPSPRPSHPLPLSEAGRSILLQP